MSNFGPRSIDVATSGQSILSTAAGGGYERRSGTSMAAATVAGALALMSAAAPDAGAAALRGALLGTAARASALPVADGTLDLAAAMRRARGMGR